MNQRTALIVAFMVTSFVLVAVGGVTATIINQPTATPPAATDTPTAVPPTPTPVVRGIDPAAVAQREAQYQKAIAAANAQLQQAYQVQKTLSDELAATKVVPTPKPRVYVIAAPAPTKAPTRPPVAVSADQAGQLALNAVPGATLSGTPELVLFQGTVAYEVTLNWGKVYIDANTGAVLYNGTTVPSSGGSSGGGSTSGGNNGGGSGGGGGNGGGDGGHDGGGHQGGGDDGGGD